VTWDTQHNDDIKSLKLRQGQLKDRLNRLTDAYLDKAIDRSTFEERKGFLLVEERIVRENLEDSSSEDGRLADRLQKFLELTAKASLSYELALPEEKREMVKILTSNREVNGKKLDFKLSNPFSHVANRFENHDCDPHRDIPRTFERLLAILTTAYTHQQLPDLSTVAGFVQREVETAPIKYNFQTKREKEG
jgi:hypothetical protein